MTQSVPLPLNAGRLHDFGDAPLRVDVEYRAGLHPERQEPLQQILRHHNLALASCLGDGRGNSDSCTIKVDRLMLHKNLMASTRA